jgi:membrane protein insertase Oxa1/YidC/SpoIIIJ
MPFLVSSFIAIRKLCALPVDSFVTGGTAWFTDLTISDPFMALPAMATLTTMAIVYVSKNKFKNLLIALFKEEKKIHCLFDFREVPIWV